MLKLDGRVLIEVANIIIKEIENSSQYKNDVVMVEEVMNNHPIFDKLLGLNELVWWEIYDYISCKIGYQEEKKHPLDFSKFTSEEKIKNFDNDYFYYCNKVGIKFDRY